MNEFQIEEYKSLTQEVRDLLKEARQLELYSAGAVAALFSWYATVSFASAAGWYLPLLIPVLGIIRSWAFHERIRQISIYLIKVEASLLQSENEELEGWENYYAKIRTHGVTPSGIVFWLLLTLVCLVFPSVYTS